MLFEPRAAGGADRLAPRFLHTADWHIGKPLRGRSRMDDYAKARDQVAAILIAGDVFDSPAPPPEAEKLVYNFLAKLIGERIQCVLIAGNHDHPCKLDALATLLESLGTHVRHEVRPPDQGGVVTLRSKDGKEEAKVAVLPFVAERKIVHACTVMDAEHKWYEEYSKRIDQILAARLEEDWRCPDRGGILYTDEMRLFFARPQASWRYVVGYEPGLMRADDLATFRRVLASRTPASFEPWVRKMGPADRLVLKSTEGPPPIPGLEWTQVSQTVWSGRKPGVAAR